MFVGIHIYFKTIKSNSDFINDAMYNTEKDFSVLYNIIDAIRKEDIRIAVPELAEWFDKI